MASKKILIDIQVSDAGASAAINKTAKSVDNLSKSTKKLSGRTTKNRAESGLNNAILLETSRLASDAAYGFQGMANNIGQLVSLLQIAKENSGGLNAVFKDLKTSIFGAGGILIAFQALISFLPDITRYLKQSAKEAGFLGGVFTDMKNKVDDTSARFEVYIKTLQSSTKSDKEKQDAIHQLNKEFPEFIINLKDAGVSMEDIQNNTLNAKSAIDAYRTSIIKLAKSQAAFNKIKELQAEILDKEIPRQEELLNLGLTEESLMKQKAISVGEFTSVQDLERDKAIQRLQSEQKEHFLFIENKQKEINALLKYVDVQRDEVKVRKEKIKVQKEERTYQMLEIENFDAQIRSIRQLGRIREFFFNKNMRFIADESTHRLSAIELEEKMALASIEALGLAEGLTQQARTEVTDYFAKERVKAEKDALFELGEAIVLAAGESSTIGKASALAMATVNTYQGITKALAEIKPPFSFVVAATTALKGFAAVKNILSTKLPYGREPSGVGGATGGTNIQAPDFNVVGASETSQLGQAVARTQKESKVNLVWDDLQNFNDTAESTTNVAVI